MSRNALTAPAHIVKQRSALSNANNSPDAAPSLFYGSYGIFDDRLPWNLANSSTAAQAVGWFMPTLIEAVPSTLSLVSIAGAAVPVAGTPMTLVSTTALGITVLSAAFLTLPSLNTVPKNSLAIDGAPGYIQFGTRDYTSFYDPTKSLSRNIQVKTNADETGATFLISGYDLYGYPMSERITGVNNTTAQGKKAFKFVTSVVPAGTLSGSNVSIGHGDTYGLPIRADQFGYMGAIWAGAGISSNTGFTAAVTSAASATTGDVRGTYAVQSASNGTNRLELSVDPGIAGFGTTPAGITTGLWGVTQA